MAKITFSKWDIAEMFGLEFVKSLEGKDYCEEVYEFRFHGKYIQMVESYGRDRDEIFEEAAEKILEAIGKAAALQI